MSPHFVLKIGHFQTNTVANIDRATILERPSSFKTELDIQ